MDEDLRLALVEVTAPAAEPLSTDEAKAHLRVDIADDDDYIDALVKTARVTVEAWANVALVNTTFDAFFDRFPKAAGALVLPRPPLSSVASVKYIDTAGTQQTLTVDDDYRVDANSKPGRITPAFETVWPTTRKVTGAVEVRFVAGYGAAAANVDPTAIEAVRQLVGHWYENREAVVLGTIATKLPLAVESLIWTLRHDGYA